MKTLKTRLKEVATSIRVGARVEIANNGNPIDELVIHHKGFCFIVDIDVASGEPTGGFSWMTDPTMTHTPIREHYKTVKLREDK